MMQQIRRGGLQTAKGFLFELTGGDVSLDFANTVDERPGPGAKDLIPAYADLVSWARQAGVLSAAREAAVRKLASRNPGKAEKARRLAVKVRESLFQIVSRLADRKEVPYEVLIEWNRIVQRALPHYEMMGSKEGLIWRPRPDELELESPVWSVVHSAVQLLTSSRASRIRKCAGSRCEWIFLDTSKRGNRRWCDMTICGNRAKARRFYSRKRSGCI